MMRNYCAHWLNIRMHRRHRPMANKSQKTPLVGFVLPPAPTEAQQRFSSLAMSTRLTKKFQICWTIKPGENAVWQTTRLTLGSAIENICSPVYCSDSKQCTTPDITLISQYVLGFCSMQAPFSWLGWAHNEWLASRAPQGLQLSIGAYSWHRVNTCIHSSIYNSALQVYFFCCWRLK